MVKIAAVCLVLVIGLTCTAGGTMVYIDTFNGSYIGDPWSAIPAGWDYFGMGAPGNYWRETARVLPPNDGTNSAWNVTMPGSCDWQPGQLIIYRDFRVNDWAAPGTTIDWSKPVYIRADVLGNDRGVNTKWHTWLQLINYERTNGETEWGNDGLTNGTWHTTTCTLTPGLNDGTVTGILALEVDFDFQGRAFDGFNDLVWENARLEYTPKLPTTPPDLSNVIVVSDTSDSANYFHVENEARTLGLRCYYPSPYVYDVPVRGDKVSLWGSYLSGQPEPIFKPAVVSVTSKSNQLPKAVSMKLSEIGGRPNSASATGPNNCGLLVRVAGKIKFVGSGFFYIDDGSNPPYGSTYGVTGIKIISSRTGLTTSSFVTVTGTVGMEAGSPNVPVIRARDTEDVVVDL